MATEAKSTETKRNGKAFRCRVRMTRQRNSAEERRMENIMI